MENGEQKETTIDGQRANTESASGSTTTTTTAGTATLAYETRDNTEEAIAADYDIAVIIPCPKCGGANVGRQVNLINAAISRQPINTQCVNCKQKLAATPRSRIIQATVMPPKQNKIIVDK